MQKYSHFTSPGLGMDSLHIYSLYQSCSQIRPSEQDLHAEMVRHGDTHAAISAAVTATIRLRRALKSEYV